MAFYEGELDIVQKLEMIERLKCSLLSKVSDLFSNMTEGDNNIESNMDLLADIGMLTYFLANNLGGNYETLDVKMINKLKLSMLDETEGTKWHKDLASLMRHLMKSHNLT